MINVCSDSAAVSTKIWERFGQVFSYRAVISANFSVALAATSGHAHNGTRQLIPDLGLGADIKKLSSLDQTDNMPCWRYVFCHLWVEYYEKNLKERLKEHKTIHTDLLLPLSLSDLHLPSKIPFQNPARSACSIPVGIVCRWNYRLFGDSRPSPWVVVLPRHTRDGPVRRP